MKRVRNFVIGVCLAAVAAGATVSWDPFFSMSAADYRGLGIMMLLGLMAERLTIATSIGKSGSTNSVAFLPLLATVLLFGPAAAIVFMAVTHGVADFIFRQKETIKGLFNLGQHVLAAAIAGLLFEYLASSSVRPEQGMGQGGYAWEALLGFGLVYLILNHAMVARVVSLSTGTEFRVVWAQVVGKGGGNFLYDLLVSPVAVAIALMYTEFGELGLVMAGLPLLAIRNAYMVAYRLQEANQDLLSALVKAIETRDPYTSGHSLRVAGLAVLVAERMGLSQRHVRQVEQSALLHDVGKIDAVYTEILRKPDALTPEERTVIRSHVAKGVELLTQLSSVPKAVIDDVRHHHERFDGKGYPDGLVGKAIPQGARIINVCDAVDAMLSDRPYREGLNLRTVREELTRYSGIQFDPVVVKTLIESDALEVHSTRVRQEKVTSPERLAGSRLHHQASVSPSSHSMA